MPEEGTSLPTVEPKEEPNYGDPKMWYQSTELWSAIIAIVAFIAQGISQKAVIPLELQASIVTLWMFILRGFKTAQPIAWTKTQFARLSSAA